MKSKVIIFFSAGVNKFSCIWLLSIDEIQHSISCDVNEIGFDSSIGSDSQQLGSVISSTSVLQQSSVSMNSECPFHIQEFQSKKQQNNYAPRRYVYRLEIR